MPTSSHDQQLQHQKRSPNFEGQVIFAFVRSKKWVLFLAVLVAVASLRVPLIHAQGPTPGIGPFNGSTYRPYAYFATGDAPNLVIWNGTCQFITCDVGQLAYTYWFFWNYHPFTVPAQNVTWEPVYVYVNIGTSNVTQVAYRGFHYLWNTIQTNATNAIVFQSGTQRPVFTFGGTYHQPKNAPPPAGGGYSQVEYNYTEVTLSTYPLTDPTPPFSLPNYAYLQLVPYLEIGVINVLAISAAWLALHARIRGKHLF